MGDLLQAAVAETPTQVWDQALDLSGNLLWLSELVKIEVPRTYSISNYPGGLLPSTIDLMVSRSTHRLSSTYDDPDPIRYGVGSSFLNPPVTDEEEYITDDEELLVGVSRPFAFQLPIDNAAPCVYFAGGSGIAPFKSFCNLERVARLARILSFWEYSQETSSAMSMSFVSTSMLDSWRCTLLSREILAGLRSTEITETWSRKKHRQDTSTLSSWSRVPWCAISYFPRSKVGLQVTYTSVTRCLSSIQSSPE